MKNTFYLRQFLFSALFLVLSAGVAAAQQFQAAGANPSDIEPTVQQFRAALGGINNGEYNSFPSGYREISWDDVPDNLAAPSITFKGDYYNTLSPRGVVFNSATENTLSTTPPFQVSADSNNPTSTPVRFGNINSTYPSTFKTYSGERLFAAPNYWEIDVVFKIPGTQTAAAVKGFGVVLTDVDTTSQTAAVYYDADGKTIGYSVAAPFNNGLTFIGMVPENGKRIARVHLILSNTSFSVATNDDDLHNLVAMDNVIFGEPRAIGSHPSDFDGDGAPDMTVFRPSEGSWYVFQSGTNTFSAMQFGLAGDAPVDGDFDGDYLNDLAVFRPSTGTWYIRNSSNAQVQIAQFGLGGDKPVVGDYDRDGRTDIALWRPTDGNFYVLQSSNNQTKITHWGITGDIPVLAGAAQ